MATFDAAFALGELADGRARAALQALVDDDVKPSDEHRGSTRTIGEQARLALAKLPPAGAPS